jgi:hypothetical protein
VANRTLAGVAEVYQLDILTAFVSYSSLTVENLKDARGPLAGSARDHSRL